ncbi:MAG: prepilin peptidase [Planctomycetes bacterium]|nr:prepilin peptidase [Planctomycetota bacterium]
MEPWFYLPTVFWCLWVLAIGLMVGSFLNVLVARLPYEKSIVWPSSRCFACYKKIRMRDNVPVLGYLLLGGKCRHCGAPFSSRYMWVEIGTGLAFLALFLGEIVFDWFGLPGVKFTPLGPEGVPSWRALALFAYHALLLSGLIAAAVVDAEHRIIPTQITYTVMAVGVLGGALMPWPWPHPASAAPVLPAHVPIWTNPDFPVAVPLGVQPWPFWGPTFAFAPPGSWQLGLLTSVFGALVGSLVVRAVKWLFETGFGREALGLGDADLLMMAGAFLGWQIPVMALFVGSFAALVLKLIEFAFRSEAPAPSGTPVSGPPEARELPFGPGLAIGVVVTWFAWPWLGPRLQFPFFDGTMMGILCGVMAVGLLAAALLLRRPAEEPVTAAR